MLAMSFKQPWLWAIVEGHKKAENRTWPPPNKLFFSGRPRPLLALHASATWDADGASFVSARLGQVGLEATRRSAILGVARVVGWTEMDEQHRIVGASMSGLFDIHGDGERTFRVESDPWAFGPYVWHLSEVVSLGDDYIQNVKGQLGVWETGPELETEIRLRLQRRLDGSHVA